MRNKPAPANQSEHDENDDNHQCCFHVASLRKSSVARMTGALPMALGNTFVQSGNYHRERVYVLAVNAGNIVVMGVAVAKAVNGGKSGGIRASQRGNAREDFVGTRRRLLVESNEGVAKQSQDARRRVGGSGTKSSFVLLG